VGVTIVGLAVDTTRTGSLCRLAVTGELDVATAPLLVERFEQALLLGPEEIVVDLCRVTLADSTGLAALIRCRRRAVRADVPLALEVGDGQVARLLDLTHLRRVFDCR
jgi:anti-sigma B factor antagonist